MKFTPSIVAQLCLLVAPLWAQSPLGKFVYKFQDPRAIQLLEVRGAKAEWSKTIGDGAPIDRPEDALPSIQVGALHLVLGSTQEYGILELTEASSLLSDWTGYDRLAFSVENASDFVIPIDLTVRDKTGTSCNSGHIWLSRARNRLEIPLEEIRDSKGHALDLAHIRSLRIDIHSAEKFERDLWFYNFYLAPARRPSIEAAPRRMLLDFGPIGSPLIAGAKLVTEKTAYAPFRGYGWTEIPGDAQAWLAHRPDRLTGDWLWADLGDSKASLRVDLPDGDYRARLYGGNYSSKLLAVRSFRLEIDGRQVAAKNVAPDTYYTEAEYFRGMNDWYEEGEDTYKRSVAGLYQTYDFPFKVKGGHVEFVWRGVLAVFGLLIAPEGTEFEKTVARVEYVRKQEFLSNLQRPTPPEQVPAASDEEKRRGFQVWSRSYEEVVGAYDRPTARERDPAILRLAAARCDHAHVTVTATPLRALGSLQASLSELRSDTGTVLPSHDLQLRALKYMWDGWPATLEEGCLLPSGAVPSRDSVNVTFWISVTPDNSVIGGSYRGTLSLTAEKGGSVVLPLEITVYPFTLTDNHPVSYAFYRGSDFNQSYSLRYFLPQKIQYYRRLLQAEITTMKSHGLTSFEFTPPFVRGVEGGHLILDFSLLEEEVRAVKELGLCDRQHPGLISLLMDLARRQLKETRYGDFQEPEELSSPLPESELTDEFSPLFKQRYVEAARQIHEYFEKRDVPVLLYLADEPRERNTNQWNRNLQDSVLYAQLVREGILGARTFIDPMRDIEDGQNYLPLLEYYDVIATHPWDQSSGIIETARKQGKPTLWYFNGIVMDRYDFGFEVAASPSTGFWQWHFQWDLLPFQRFHPCNRSGVTLPGPDGPIETPTFERLTAGIGDYRYVATLKDSIEAAKQSGKKSQALEAAQAELKVLMANTMPFAYQKDYSEPIRPRRSINGRSLDEWRAVLAKHISALE